MKERDDMLSGFFSNSYSKQVIIEIPLSAKNRKGEGKKLKVGQVQ
jgi:hypothetical protein